MLVAGSLSFAQTNTTPAGTKTDSATTAASGKKNNDKGKTTNSGPKKKAAKKKKKKYSCLEDSTSNKSGSVANLRAAPIVSGPLRLFAD
jgi:hypothetical protein